jgi:pimeloyl-ACP methyl ester carboxylesterase
LSFAYVEQGDGSPVILVHGSVSDYREWANQMAPLARRYRVIAYSRRYHWPNPPPDAGADARLERQVDDLAAIMTTMHLTPAHVVGHSIGGAIALQLARRHPELVRTLILIEPAVIGVLGSLPDDDPVSKEAHGIRAAMKDAFASGDAERIVRTYAAHVAPGEFEKASPEIRQMLLANVPAFQLDNTSRCPPFTCDDAERVGLPALVVSGGRSPMACRR